MGKNAPKSTAVTGYINSDNFLTGMRRINLRQTLQTVDPGAFFY
jgi:hypothetical protein